ncbi:MAG: hypothetical protein HC820_01485 [Hydrococcus sp. RM1_1_31]|nr:hypothetical protein [Hydrococcus sp. RM1_1_31]
MKAEINLQKNANSLKEDFSLNVNRLCIAVGKKWSLRATVPFSVRMGDYNQQVASTQNQAFLGSTVPL